MRIITRFSRNARFSSKKALTYRALRDIIHLLLAQCAREVVSMAVNKIYFSNLRAEMARGGLTIGDIAEKLSVSRDKLSRTLGNKSSIDLNTACKIRNTFFPELTLEYLFVEILYKNDA